MADKIQQIVQGIEIKHGIEILLLVGQESCKLNGFDQPLGLLAFKCYL